MADRGYFAADGCTYMAILARPELLRDGKLVRRRGGEPWRVTVRPGSTFHFLVDRAIEEDGWPNRTSSSWR